MFPSSLGCAREYGNPGLPGQPAPSPVGKARGRGHEVVLIYSAGRILLALKSTTDVTTTTVQVSDLINYPAVFFLAKHLRERSSWGLD